MIQSRILKNNNSAARWKAKPDYQRAIARQPTNATIAYFTAAVACITLFRPKRKHAPTQSPTTPIRTGAMLR